MHAEPREFPRPTVQLLHTLPDGSSHVDWMLARGDAPEPLVTFRVGARIDELPADTEVEVERIKDHRREYLDYEGPVSGNRGVVTRVCEGVIVAWTGNESNWQLDIEWTGGPSQRLRLTRDRVECMAKG